MKDQKMEVEGKVTSVLPGTKFKVELSNQKEIICTLCGKMKQHFIKVTPGDNVSVEMSKYDLTKGRILFRYRG